MFLHLRHSFLEVDLCSIFTGVRFGCSQRLFLAFGLSSFHGSRSRHALDHLRQQDLIAVKDFFVEGFSFTPWLPRNCTRAHFGCGEGFFHLAGIPRPSGFRAPALCTGGDLHRSWIFSWTRLSLECVDLRSFFLKGIPYWPCLTIPRSLFVHFIHSLLDFALVRDSLLGGDSMIFQICVPRHCSIMRWSTL